MFFKRLSLQAVKTMACLGKGYKNVAESIDAAAESVYQDQTAGR